MAIRDTYAEIIAELILREILREGEAPSASEITSRFETFVAENDISQPLFDALTAKVEKYEVSSVSKYNTTNTTIQQDLRVLYKHLFKVSDQTIQNFERWRNESRLLEGRLDDLNERINSLLLLSNDTAGFFNFMQDNFVDNRKVDLQNSTTYTNVAKGVLTMGTSSLGSTRVDLDDLRDEHVEFTVLTRKNLVSSVSADGSRTSYVVSDINNYWQERVHTSKPGPISVELKINLLRETDISRIDVDLHMSNQNSTIQVTPQYSTDNYNWTQLPVTTPTRSILDKATFQFAPVTAKWVKFIMTKVGFDQVHKELYAYEFGVDEVAFFNESFSADAVATFVSKPLSVLDSEGNPQEFSRIVLEVCEDVPDDTKIDYFVAAFNDETASIGGFVPIDPLTRSNSTKPTVLDFGDLDSVTIEDIQVSYDPAGATGFVNPAETYTRIHDVLGATPDPRTGTASAVRYSFFNSNERLLDHVLAPGITIAQGTLELWRNTSAQNDETLVRGNVNGWGFDDPWYRTTVFVENALGYDLDFGGEPVIVDGVPVNGRVNVSSGRHTILVHKDNWKAIDLTSVTDLETLKAADSLYPYNHRYMVEGLAYPSGFPTTDEQIYRGFDIVAEYFMKEVSIFDIINNMAADNYERFALDKDAADASRLIDAVPATTDEQTPQNSFVVKVDENNPDFLNEKFLLRFKSANALFKFLRLKAELSTTNDAVAPFLDSYRIKISS